MTSASKSIVPAISLDRVSNENFSPVRRQMATSDEAKTHFTGRYEVVPSGLSTNHMIWLQIGTDVCLSYHVKHLISPRKDNTCICAPDRVVARLSWNAPIRMKQRHATAFQDRVTIDLE